MSLALGCAEPLHGRDLRRGPGHATALEIAPPSIYWGAKEIVIDALHRAVYAAAAGAAYRAIAV